MFSQIIVIEVIRSCVNQPPTPEIAEHFPRLNFPIEKLSSVILFTNAKVNTTNKISRTKTQKRHQGHQPSHRQHRQSRGGRGGRAWPLRPRIRTGPEEAAGSGGSGLATKCYK